MTDPLRIAEVADRVGISTATIRYYERIGLLPRPERAANGYRVYDDRTVERLEFVARAKRLGCSLDEIADLVVAWDGGECGPIQDLLWDLVAAKLAAARAEMVGLVTLTADLRRAAAALEHHRPVGRCDDTCGCTADASAHAPAVDVELSDRPSNGGAAIACTLGSEDVAVRLADWNRVVADAVARDAIPGGVRLTFADGANIGDVARLAAAEQQCCRFFAFRIDIDQAGVALEITAPEDALDVVHAVFDAPRNARSSDTSRRT